MSCSSTCWPGSGGGVCCTWFTMRACVGCSIIGDTMVAGPSIGEIMDPSIWEGGGGAITIPCWGLYGGWAKIWKTTWWLRYISSKRICSFFYSLHPTVFCVNVFKLIKFFINYSALINFIHVLCIFTGMYDIHLRYKDGIRMSLRKWVIIQHLQQQNGCHRCRTCCITTNWSR